MKDTEEMPSAQEAARPTKLSGRLMEIVSCVPPCDRAIDVGSDHGHVISYLLENRIASRAVATDIHADPAETTKRYLRRQGVMHLAEVVHTDGLHGIPLVERDVVIISGLGGLEMIRILSEAREDRKGVFPSGMQFILQPQRSSEELRTFLSGSGFHTNSEKACWDRDRFYLIICAAWTGVPGHEMSLTERTVGPYFLENRPENLEKYLHHQRNVLKKQMRARPELAEVISNIDMILRGESLKGEVPS
jgi:tRNA A22 N-methylase